MQGVNEGRIAKVNGMQRNDNPYEAGTLQHDEWDYGFCDDEEMMLEAA